MQFTLHMLQVVLTINFLPKCKHKSLADQLQTMNAAFLTTLVVELHSIFVISNSVLDIWLWCSLLTPLFSSKNMLQVPLAKAMHVYWYPLTRTLHTLNVLTNSCIFCDAAIWRNSSTLPS